MPMIEFGQDWKRPVYLGFTHDLKIFNSDIVFMLKLEFSYRTEISLNSFLRINTVSSKYFKVKIVMAPITKSSQFSRFPFSDKYVKKYVFGWMSHPTYVISQSPQAK